MFDLARQENRNLCSISMGAEKCYDRIYPGFATIAMMRLGLPQIIEVSLEKTQCFMSHKVRTMAVISK